MESMMIIVLKAGVSEADETRVLNEIESRGYSVHVIREGGRVIIAAFGKEQTPQTLEALTSWPQVEKVTPVQKRYKLVKRGTPQERTIVRINDHVSIGGNAVHLMAGPCSVESEKQIMTVAESVKASGATILRGGAFKPRTSPYEFQGLGEKGLKLLDKARKATGLAIITECLSEEHVELVAEYTDIIQIGTRNAQNFQLLIAAAHTGKPILLKRGSGMKIEEWLLAGEYILNSGNPNLLFCERGIRTFETYTRNTLDLSAIPIMKKETHCPIVIDPSQGCGSAKLVDSLCIGAVAMGADALLIEVHPDPAHAWSDGPQQITLEEFARLSSAIRPFLTAAGRTLGKIE